jgi:hypothetical protein
VKTLYRWREDRLQVGRLKQIKRSAIVGEAFHWLEVFS